MRFHKGLNFYCVECGKDFTTQSEVYTHACSKSEFKKQLNKATSETGALFVDGSS